MRSHDRVNLRNTHPTLWRSIMVLALMSVALAVNFWTSTPTFSPFDIPKDLIGCVFALLGLWQIVFLNVNRLRDLRRVRLGLATSFSFFLVWGLSNAQQAVAGKASYQLPILYIFLAVLQMFLLTESPVNPMTQRAER